VSSQLTSTRNVPSMCCVLALLLVLNGCGSYPQVSESAYSLTKSLHSICDNKSAEQLDQFEQVVGEKVAAGELTEEEQRTLQGIVSTARKGKWDAAKKEARALMRAQNSA